MRIAIQAADLDCERIDGTRVYILNLLRRFGTLSPKDEFIIYHKKIFNPELTPPNFSNYKIKKLKAPLFWTQIRLALKLVRDKPDILWMPMHNIPFLKSKRVKTTVTIHDLAFKIFPDHFPKKDLIKLNFLTNLAVKYADKIIVPSESSKKDVLRFYPAVKKEKVKVIYHGFDANLFSQERNLEKEREIKNKLGINGEYILYSGAIQPRKNLGVLIEAFGLLKKRNKENNEIKKNKLVLAGEKAWMSDDVANKVKTSSYSSDIILPGKIKFEDIGHLTRGASVYVFSSLYEGFGITILEAMAADAPVICSRNSSLPEVGGDAVLYFNANNPAELADKIEKVLGNENLRRDLINRGQEQVKKFSWDKCAQETLDWIKE